MKTNQRIQTVDWLIDSLYSKQFVTINSSMFSLELYLLGRLVKNNLALLLMMNFNKQQRNCLQKAKHEMVVAWQFASINVHANTCKLYNLVLKILFYTIAKKKKKCDSESAQFRFCGTWTCLHTHF